MRPGQVAASHLILVATWFQLSPLKPVLALYLERIDHVT